MSKSGSGLFGRLYIHPLSVHQQECGENACEHFCGYLHNISTLSCDVVAGHTLLIRFFLHILVHLLTRASPT